jgi:hypothetical protein
MNNTNTLPQNDPLWQRLQDYQFDDTNSSLTFSTRLTRENGWTKEYTDRVLTEYQKFIYLALKSGHPVTPSEDIDQAWHLHIVYTRQYNEFCEKILQQRLEHGPTKGGKEEKDKFEEWYEKTLASYERLFAIDAPPDIWPSVRKRFATANFVRVNEEKSWVLAKGSLWQAFKLLLKELKAYTRGIIVTLIIVALVITAAFTEQYSLLGFAFILCVGFLSYTNRVANRGSNGGGSGCGGGCTSGDGHSGCGNHSGCGGDSGCGSSCGGGGCGGD